MGVRKKRKKPSGGGRWISSDERGGGAMTVGPETGGYRSAGERGSRLQSDGIALA
jgi:hypothetical protein